MNITHNIKEIKFKINQNIKVINLIDKTGNRYYLNKIGLIKYFNFDCGCEQTFPHNPMIGIKFFNGKIEEFWKEEITKI